MLQKMGTFRVIEVMYCLKHEDGGLEGSAVADWANAPGQ
jgi:hypothetical protein